MGSPGLSRHPGGFGVPGLYPLCSPHFPPFSAPPPSLWQSPELLSDIQDGYSVSGHLLVCFSSGKQPHGRDTLGTQWGHI